MFALNIRDIGDRRKAALDAEAKAQGVPVSELVRRLVDEGLERSRSARAQQGMRSGSHQLISVSSMTADHNPAYTLADRERVHTFCRHG